MLFSAKEKGGENRFNIWSDFGMRLVYGMVIPIVDDRNGRVDLGYSLLDAPNFKFEKSTTFFRAESASAIDFRKGIGLITSIEEFQPVDRHA